MIFYKNAQKIKHRPYFLALPLLVTMVMISAPDSVFSNTGNGKFSWWWPWKSSDLRFNPNLRSVILVPMPRASCQRRAPQERFLHLFLHKLKPAVNVLQILCVSLFLCCLCFDAREHCSFLRTLKKKKVGIRFDYTHWSSRSYLLRE